jgi:hypothetical protein
MNVLGYLEKNLLFIKELLCNSSLLSIVGLCATLTFGVHVCTLLYSTILSRYITHNDFIDLYIYIFPLTAHVDPLLGQPTIYVSWTETILGISQTRSHRSDIFTSLVTSMKRPQLVGNHSRN